MKKIVTIILSLLSVIVFANTVYAGTWKQDSKGWWWDNGNGTWPANCWQWCDGNNDGIAECYYFDANGYCLMNTTTPDGYKVNKDGAWIKNGVVQTQSAKSNTTSKQNGWIKDGRGWKYYENGKYLTEKIITESDGCSYIVGKDGYMVSNGWYGSYYVDANGLVLKNTITPDGYYVDSNGLRVAGYQNGQVSQSQNRCYRCNGKGIETCGICLGNPLQFCFVCNGTGGKSSFLGVGCTFCNGTGYSKCMYCNGRGYNICSLCSGSGYVIY